VGAQPEPRMPELFADLAHDGMLAGNEAWVEMFQIRMKRRQRRISICGLERLRCAINFQKHDSITFDS
jgi:hypothetical protein